MKVPNQPQGLQVDSSLKTFYNYVVNWIWQPLAKAINSIDFGDGSSSGNINGQWVTVFFSQTNADTLVSHTLGRIPSGYIIMAADAATSIYTGVSLWTSSAIYLRSSTANVNVKLLLV